MGIMEGMLEINAKPSAVATPIRPDFSSYYIPTAKTLSPPSKRSQSTSSRTWFEGSSDLRYRSAKGIQK